MASTDPFAKRGKIHIYFVQQSKKRARTELTGLDEDLDLDRICRHMKRAFSVGAHVQDKSIILQGDMRDQVQEWLVKEEVLTEKEAKERIVLHGA